MRSVLFTLISISTIPLLAKDHSLKKGETLATLARTYYGEPVFGPKGSLKKILALNPQLKGNPNAVEPGQVIHIDDNLPAVKISADKPMIPKKSASKIIVDFDKKLDAEILNKAPEGETKEKITTPIELQNPPDLVGTVESAPTEKPTLAVNEPRKSVGSDP